MRIIKKEICEIIDSNNNLIGANNIPQNGSNLETQANKTTDYNQKVGTQPYRYDMLGRFGFTLFPFFEGENEKFSNNDELLKSISEFFMKVLEYYFKNPNKIKSDYRILSDKEDVDNEIRERIEKYWLKIIADVFESTLKEKNNKIDESSLIEDRVVDKKSENEISNKSKDNTIRNKNLTKIVDLINKKLEKNEIDKLINLLENND